MSNHSPPVVVARERSTSPGWPTTRQLWNRARTSPMAVAFLALRSLSPVPREALALAVGQGRVDDAALLDAARSGALDPYLVRTAAPALSALALAWAGQGRGEEELQASADVYEGLFRSDLLRGLPPLTQQLAVQVLLLSGRPGPVRGLLEGEHDVPEDVLPHVLADLAHPDVTPAPPARLPAGVVDAPDPWWRWEQLLSAPFTRAGLARLWVDQAEDELGTPLFDRLRSEGTVARSVDGPLVTVVIPCFRPDQGLLTSVGSVAAQTYGAMEIILVDDGSGSEYADLLERAAALDDRTRVVRLEHNGGVYLARNAALSVARGRFVTFQDADDWSHPQRVAEQVRLLDEQPGAAASRSQAIRAKDDLTHQWLGYSARRDNASSLMLRATTLAAVGPFLPVRKGGDSELAERVVALHGPVADTGTALAVTRLRAGSLSRDDFSYQWSAPDRLVFRGVYRSWHRDLSARAEEARERGREPAPVTRLTLPVPPTFVRDLLQGRPDDDPGGSGHVLPRLSLPVTYLADFSADPTEEPQDLDDLAPLLHRHLIVRADAAGPSVGLWHLEAPRAAGRSRPEMHPRWYDLVTSGVAQAVVRTDPVHLDRLVVLDPRSLLLATAQECVLQVERVEVVALSVRAGEAVDLLGAGDAVRQWWGVAPVWLPEGVQAPLPG